MSFKEEIADCQDKMMLKIYENLKSNFPEINFDSGEKSIYGLSKYLSYRIAEEYIPKDKRRGFVGIDVDDQWCYEVAKDYFMNEIDMDEVNEFIKNTIPDFENSNDEIKDIKPKPNDNDDYTEYLRLKKKFAKPKKKTEDTLANQMSIFDV